METPKKLFVPPLNEGIKEPGSSGSEDDREGGSPNKIKFKRYVSESEKSCIESGYFCKDPWNTFSYTVEWPDPTQMSILLIRKPNDPSIDEWADKIISYFCSDWFV